ncbi:hypothetical protein LOK49_LG09G00623 [Camellia lanceoleosa]|uniref:Uncharacterized protein n=1 Tax=Camellia lanceoleosa TaxID=1840588 RepID=A0ACC0GI24_9ERIC|nr:hypothetical protein LOK49_LG09G00623 [Camellia lanceoleosa]
MVVLARRGRGRGSGRWGTWEELILGGAVLRHGTQAWDAVASELQARTIYPYSFTPEACKAKYADLQQRYSGCTAWFEELRKRRVAELRRELEKSEDSIGSLESKLKSLKAEKGDCGHIDVGSSQTDSPIPTVKSEDCGHVDVGSSQTDSPIPIVKSEGVESSGKDISKDGLSASSFTQDISTNWLPEHQILATASAAEIDTKPEISESLEPEKCSSIKKLVETGNERGRTLRKRRGKRKRKDCNREPKEVSIGDSENLGSTNVITASSCKENSTGDCGPTVRSSSINDHNGGSCGTGNDDLMGIFNSVAENEIALVFRRRLDSQKRARYKKTIRRHVDLDTIRSKIASCNIVSVKVLFRDLLLLANNALVFYSRRTREYKTALLLRDIVTKAYQQHCKDSRMRAVSPSPSPSPTPVFPLFPRYNPPVKPRSTRPRKRKLSVKLPNAGNMGLETPQGCKKPSNVENAVERCKKPSTAEIFVSGKPSCTECRPSMESLMMGNEGFSTESRPSMDSLMMGNKGFSAESRPSMESLMMGNKGFSWIGKVGCRAPNPQSNTTVKERKRVRRR